MADNDIIVLEHAREASFALDKAYRRAVDEADLDRIAELKPSVDQAYDKLSQARLNLLKEGVLADEEDVAALQRIRAEIEEAANTQQMIQGAAKLVAKLAKFVV